MRETEKKLINKIISLRSVLHYNIYVAKAYFNVVFFFLFHTNPFKEKKRSIFSFSMYK